MEPTGTLRVALEHAGRLLQTDPNLAIEQVREILAAVPKHPVALLLLGAAQRAAGDPASALDTFEKLLTDQPSSAAAHLELAISLDAAGKHDRSLSMLRRAVALKPDLADGWRAIDDTETEVRRLLEHCGLPFESSCLRFHENGRAVRTASKQQVRQPIFREGLDHWRHFASWLDPAKLALGTVLDDYPCLK